MKQVIVVFPQSQVIEDKEGFFDNAELINSDKGISLYGGGAYIVNEEWYNKVINNEIPTKEYTEDEMEKNLVINYSFPIEMSMKY